MEAVEWIGMVIAFVAGGVGVAWAALSDLRRPRSGDCGENH
jgi:hypothetical protein